MIRRRLARAGAESGQVLPILMLSLVLTVAVGFLLFEVGAASRLKSENRTAADAAALAGEQNVKVQLIALLVTGQVSPEDIQWPLVYAEAQVYAERNGSTITKFEHIGYDVRVTARTNRTLKADDVDRENARAVSKSRASLSASYSLGGAGANLTNVSSSAASGGTSAVGSPAAGSGANPIPKSELKSIAEKAHVKIRPDSALIRYANFGNGDGPNVAQLATEMKVDIAKAEDLLGAPLILNSAYRTAAYQASLCARTSGRCAAPGASLHNFGLAIDVANYTQLATVATKAGLCEPFPNPGDDVVHFSPIDGPECGGHGGPLPTGQAFGGNPASYVSYDAQLVPFGSDVPGL